MTSHSQAGPPTSVPSPAPDDTSAPTTPVSEPLATTDMRGSTPPADLSQSDAPASHIQLQIQPRPHFLHTAAQPGQQTSNQLEVTVAPHPASSISPNDTESPSNEAVQSGETAFVVNRQVALEPPVISPPKATVSNAANDKVSDTMSKEEKKEIDSKSVNLENTQQTGASENGTAQMEPHSDENTEQLVEPVLNQSVPNDTIEVGAKNNQEVSLKDATGDEHAQDDGTTPQVAEHKHASSHKSLQRASSQEGPISIESPTTSSGSNLENVHDHSKNPDAPSTSGNLDQTTASCKKRSAETIEGTTDGPADSDYTPSSPTKRQKLDDGNSTHGLATPDSTSQPSPNVHNTDGGGPPSAVSGATASEAMNVEAMINPCETKPATPDPEIEKVMPGSVKADVPVTSEHQSTDPATLDVPTFDAEISADPTLAVVNFDSVENALSSADAPSPIPLLNPSISNAPITSAQSELPMVSRGPESGVSLADNADETPKQGDSTVTAPESTVSTATPVVPAGGSIVSAPLALRSAPTGGISGVGKGMLKLRSSPVIPASDDQSGKGAMDTTNQILIPGKGVLAGGTSRAKREKKVRNVKWAAGENIADVRFIDTRLNLVKSWDPDCEITLPFAPHTLQAIKSLIKGPADETSIPSDVVNTCNDEDGASFGLPETGITAPDFGQCAALPIISSFEEARKRERDMEQERVMQAKEKLKNRLNSMGANVPWHSPRSIVLPVECQIEDNAVASFDASDERYSVGCMTSSSSNNAESPMSPPSEAWGWADGNDGFDSQAQIFPLTDSNTSTDMEVDSFEMQRASINGIWNSGAIRSNDHRNMSGPVGSYSGALNENVQMEMMGRAGGTRQNVGNERYGGLRMGNGSGGLRGGVDHDMEKPSGRDKPRLVLSPNVRHLLSALQSSGVLNGTKMNEVLGRSEGREPEDDARSIAVGRPNCNDMRMGDMGGNNYNNMNEDTRMSDQMNIDNGNGVAGNIGRMMGAVSAPVPRAGPAGMMGGPPFGPGIGQGGILECMPFGMPPVPPNAMGLPPPPGLMQMGLGLHMPPMVGMAMLPMVPGNPMAMNGPGGNGNAGGVMVGNGMGMGGLNIPNNVGGPVAGMNGPENGGLGGGGLIPALVGGGVGGGGGNVLGRGGKGGRNGRHVETITRPKSKGLKQRKKCKYFGTKQGCRDGDACMFSHI